MTSDARTAETRDLTALDGLRVSVVRADAQDARHTFVWLTPLKEDALDELHRQWNELTYSYRRGFSDSGAKVAERLGVTLPAVPEGPGEFGGNPDLSFGEWRRRNKEYQSHHHAYLASLGEVLFEARTRLLTRSGAIDLGTEWISDACTFSDDTDIDGYGSGQVRLALYDDAVWSCGSDGGDGYTDLSEALRGAGSAATRVAKEVETRNRDGVLAMSHLELFGITPSSEYRGDPVADEVLALTAAEFAAVAEARRAGLLATHALKDVEGRSLVSKGVQFAHDPTTSARGAYDSYLSRSDVARLPESLVTALLEALHDSAIDDVAY
jgi:hypothetical protein